MTAGKTETESERDNGTERQNEAEKKRDRNTTIYRLPATLVQRTA